MLRCIVGLRSKLSFLNLAALAYFQHVTGLILLDEALRWLDLPRAILLLVLLEFKLACISAKSHEGLLLVLPPGATASVIFIIIYFVVLTVQITWVWHIIKLLEHLWGLELRIAICWALALKSWNMLVHGIGASLILLLRWFTGLVEMLIIVACWAIACISWSLRSRSLAFTS